MRGRGDRKRGTGIGRCLSCAKVVLSQLSPDIVGFSPSFCIYIFFLFSESPINNFTAILPFTPCPGNILHKENTNIVSCARSCLLLDRCKGFVFSIKGNPCQLLKETCVGKPTKKKYIFYLKKPLNNTNIKQNLTMNYH